MQPEVGRSYSRSEALALFSANGRSPAFWGGQLVIARDALVFLATLGPGDTAPHFPTPSHFQFRPIKKYTKAADVEWMPKPLANNHRIGRSMHLFANQEPKELYLYLGQLVGGFNYCGGSDYRQQVANFTLDPRLSRDLWLRFGGYPAWKVSVNHRDVLLDMGDEEGFEKYLEEVGSKPDSHLVLTRYEGDSLRLLTNSRQGYLCYEFAGGYRSSRNPKYPEDIERVALFRCTCGICLEMPLCYAIPKSRAVNALAAYFRTGQLSESIEWRAE